MARRALVLAVLALLVLPTAAEAALQPVFGLRGIPNPKLGYFVYQLKAGATKTGAVLVTNNGKAAGTVRLYPADGTTGQTTGTVYLTDRTPRRAGAWITLQRSRVTLSPGGHEVVHFTVHVPAGASAGQWVAGLVAETTNVAKGKRTKSKASVQVRIRSQTILAVQVDVPGPAKAAFTIGKVSAGGTRGFQQVLVEVANRGNQLAKPKGTLTIVDAKGATVETLPFTMDTFLPQTSVNYPVVLKKALPAGAYTANVSLTYPAGSGSKTVVARPQFTVTKQNVQQVFTTSKPTQAASGAAGSSGGGTSTLTIVAIAVGGLILLALLAILWVLLKGRGPKQA